MTTATAAMAGETLTPQVVGPVHGACYLGIVVLALLLAGLPLRRRLVDRTARRVSRPNAARADRP